MHGITYKRSVKALDYLCTVATHSSCQAGDFGTNPAQVLFCVDHMFSDENGKSFCSHVLLREWKVVLYKSFLHKTVVKPTKIHVNASYITTGMKMQNMTVMNIHTKKLHQLT